MTGLIIAVAALTLLCLVLASGVTRLMREVNLIQGEILALTFILAALRSQDEPEPGQ